MQKFIDKFLAPISILLSIHPSELDKIVAEIERFQSTGLTELTDHECDVWEAINTFNTALLWQLVEQAAFRKRRAIIAGSGNRGLPASDRKREAGRRNVQKRWAKKSAGQVFGWEQAGAEEEKMG